MSKEGKVWGFRGAQYRNPSRTPMYLPQVHIGPRSFFRKFSLVGPKNRFFPEWANVTRYLNFVLQVLFEVGLTPNYRGFNVGNFARDLKFFEFLVISAILRISPIWLDPPPLFAWNAILIGKIEPDHLGGPYSQGRCTTYIGPGFYGR